MQRHKPRNRLQRTIRAEPRHPSNAQLADPKIEARVDRLLRQMTLEEKIGQLVQYNDTGDASPAPPAKGDKAAYSPSTR